MKAVAKGAARRLPPVLVGTLVLMWLLLNQTVTLGHILLGFVLALALAWASAALRPLQPRFARPQAVAALLVLVLLDIIRSNVSVARIVLGLVGDREVRSGFVRIPLQLADPHGLAVLAGIVTATPGTVWVDHDLETSTLTLHVLDLRDEAEWIDWIKNRYERRLMEIYR
jgi:multicomponent K+:H+ antiporter subunit E